MGRFPQETGTEGIIPPAGDLGGTVTSPAVRSIGGVAVALTSGATADVLAQQSDGSFKPAVSVAVATDTATTATASVPTPSTGVAFTPSASQDCELSFAVSTAATFAVTFGPTTGAEHTILTSTALGIGTFVSKRIPAGWKVIITGTIADLENILAVTC